MSTEENTIQIEFEDTVATLLKPGAAIFAGITPHHCNLMHLSLGITTEVGEVLDHLKKYMIYGKPLDFTKIQDELGDLEFYLEGLRQALGITREQCMETTSQKLQKRYKGRYTDTSAINQADKKEA